MTDVSKFDTFVVMNKTKRLYLNLEFVDLIKNETDGAALTDWPNQFNRDNTQ